MATYRGPIQIRKIVRYRAHPHHGHHTLFFHVETGRRGHFLQPHEVPEFDGENGWFECQKIGQQIVVHRQVETPPGSR